jgi:hypothetical protein
VNYCACNPFRNKEKIKRNCNASAFLTFLERSCKENKGGQTIGTKQVSKRTLLFLAKTFATFAVKN